MVEKFTNNNLDFIKMNENYYSQKDDLFSKDIKNIDFGKCSKINICQHDDIIVTYIDETIKHFILNSQDVRELCKKYDKPCFEHFLL